MRLNFFFTYRKFNKITNIVLIMDDEERRLEKLKLEYDYVKTWLMTLLVLLVSISIFLYNLNSDHKLNTDLEWIIFLVIILIAFVTAILHGELNRIYNFIKRRLISNTTKIVPKSDK